MTFIKNFAAGVLFFVIVLVAVGIPATALTIASALVASTFGPVWGFAALVGGIAVLGGFAIAVMETVSPIR